jgi:hypothetical protein
MSILVTPLGGCGFGGIRFRRDHTHARHNRLFGNLSGNTLNPVILALDNRPNGITKIEQQVPAVGNLNSVWRALTYAIRIAPARSRATISIPGCLRSDFASVSACRSGSRARPHYAPGRPEWFRSDDRGASPPLSNGYAVGTLASVA